MFVELEKIEAVAQKRHVKGVDIIYIHVYSLRTLEATMNSKIRQSLNLLNYKE
jgi:hypothetical protein